ncbi:MAG: hypothetical protein LBV38_01045, partial [Alistipes sp.]|nr:hypothetical protein [Alistipes sp.]
NKSLPAFRQIDACAILEPKCLDFLTLLAAYFLTPFFAIGGVAFFEYIRKKRAESASRSDAATMDQRALTRRLG